MRKHRSKLQTDENCCVCGSPYTEEHHALHGFSNRKKADRLGLIVYICHQHHMDLHDRNHDLDLYLQQKAQAYFEEELGDRNDFIKEFGKSYL